MPDELKEMLDQFTEEYKEASLYGGYSRTLKRKLKKKSEVQAEFIENMVMLQKVSLDPVVIDAIGTILKRFE